MKNKIIRQCTAAVAALLIVYGVGVNTFHSYEQVKAAQAEIPPAIAAKNDAATGESESIAAAVTTDTATATTTETPSTAISEPATTVTEIVTASAAAPVETPAIVAATPAAEEPVVAEPQPDVPSLSEFLSQLRCGGCGKNCSLLNPRCGVGNQKAQQAEAEYVATYN